MIQAVDWIIHDVGHLMNEEEAIKVQKSLDIRTHPSLCLRVMFMPSTHGIFDI